MNQNGAAELVVPDKGFATAFMVTNKWSVTGLSSFFLNFFYFFLFIYDSHTEIEREAETQAEGEAGSMHREPDVGFDPGSPGSRPGPKASTKPLRHPGIPKSNYL